MTDLDLDRLEALADAATEGPWITDHVYSPASVVPHTWTVESTDGYTEGDGAALSDIECLREADAEFIAAAREAVPALIAEVHRLRAILAHATAGWTDAEGDIARALAVLDAVPVDDRIGTHHDHCHHHHPYCLTQRVREALKGTP